MYQIIANPNICIKPTVPVTQKWLIEHLQTKKTFLASDVIIYILLYCIQPRNRDEIFKTFNDIYQINILENLCDQLIMSNLLLESSKEKNNLLPIEHYTTIPHWQKYQWLSAAEYHYFTYDYPFHPYRIKNKRSQEGLTRIMSYCINQPDNDRYKIHHKVINSIDCGTPDPTQLSLALEQGSSKTIKEKILLLLIVLFKGFAEKNVKWNGLPLAKRISFSCDSRQAIEGYFLNIDIPLLSRGLYHIPIDTKGIHLIRQGTFNNLPTILPELFFEHDNAPCAFIILTGIYERMMHIHHEPRALRAIYLDAGHILGTAEIVSSRLKLLIKITYNFEIQNLEKILAIEDLQESPLAVIGIYEC